jgi:hypothetical protein
MPIRKFESIAGPEDAKAEIFSALDRLDRTLAYFSIDLHTNASRFDVR